MIGVDIEPGMVRYLNERARREQLGNVSAQLGGSDGPGLAAPVDLVIAQRSGGVPGREPLA